MKKLGVFMADGCEEIEALTVVDIARRAGIEVAMISITGEKIVKGAHGIHFETDIPAEFMDFDMLDGIVLPGGMPGTLNLGANKYVLQTIIDFNVKGKLVSAICAAPSVLGEAGLLNGKKATSYPGFEEKLVGADVCEDAVVVDGNIITSRGMGTAIAFGTEIVRYFTDDATVEKIHGGLVYKGLL